MIRRNICIMFCLLTMSFSTAFAEDWPMWRYDAGRKSTTSEQLPEQLQLQWVRSLPQPQTAWPDGLYKVQFDAAYEPIVKGSLLYIASMNADSLTAYDIESGEQQWVFYADGPLRFAPVVYKNKIFFVSDDGYFYCVDNENGNLISKIQTVPDNRKIIGNNRVVSMWPARGAPVLEDGIIYFAAGIWPFMGTFITALDADTLETLWCNSGSGSTYTVQQHTSPAFSGVAPQGYLSISGNILLVSGGRTTPAAYHKKTGQLMYYKPASRVFSKATGGFAVSAIDGYFTNQYGVFDLDSGDEIAKLPMGIYDNQTCYAINKKAVAQFTIANLEVIKKEVTKWGVKGWSIKTQEIPVDWQSSVEADTVFAKAGNTLYVSSGLEVKAIHIDGSKSHSVWQYTVASKPLSMVVANQKLFVSTEKGKIYCFGDTNTKTQFKPQEKPLTCSGTYAVRVQDIIQESGSAGYALLLGVGSGELIKELLKQSEYHIVVVEEDQQKATLFRTEMDACGVYGSRLAVISEALSAVSFAPYLFSLIAAEEESKVITTATLQALRPYGGVAYLPKGVNSKIVESSTVENLTIRENDTYIVAKREGALPGSSSWTHQAADAANTMCSADSLPQTPLGLLWFGGASNNAVLPRHGHGPAPQVIGGRLFIEGKDMLRAVDVYTGRLLWQKKIKNLGLYYNNTGHHAGANGIGSNYVSADDAIYVMLPEKCLVLDPATGEEIKNIIMPDLEQQSKLKWGHIKVDQGYLIATAAPASVYLSSNAAMKVKLKKKTTVFPIEQNADYAVASQYLVVFDRVSGEKLWERKAEHNFRHNAIVAAHGKIFCIDAMTKARKEQWKRTYDVSSAQPVLYALDAASGAVLWQTDKNVFGTWLAYSEEHNILVQSGIAGRDRERDEEKGVAGINAVSGEQLWKSDVFLGRSMLYHDRIIGEKTALDIRNGKPYTWTNPIDGKEFNWQYRRNYGCNGPVASEHLLTFRSAAAGYYDLKNNGGTGNLGGFKSGCTSNLIAADGVLNAPDYTRTCKCSYQNQSSLAMIHMPEIETWTFNPYMLDGDAAKTVKRIGINLGAPGDRRDAAGTVWINYPHEMSPSPKLSIWCNEDVLYTRHHSMLFTGLYNWVGSSYAENIQDMTIHIGDSANYTVTLHFAEYNVAETGRRIMNIALQGQTVLESFDIAEAAGANTSISKVFAGIAVEGSLHIQLEAITGTTLLSGIEIIKEE